MLPFHCDQSEIMSCISAVQTCNLATSHMHCQPISCVTSQLCCVAPQVSLVIAIVRPLAPCVSSAVTGCPQLLCINLASRRDVRDVRQFAVVARTPLLPAPRWRH